MSHFLKRRSPTDQQQSPTRSRSSIHATSDAPSTHSSALIPYASPTTRHDDMRQIDRVEHVKHVEVYTSDHRASGVSSTRQSYSSLLSGMRGMMGGAVEVTMSRSTVVYDGERTYVEAEEQQLRGGRWEQQRMEGVWEGDQSREAIQRLSRQSRARQALGIRTLPRSKKR
jgi:hypothetical protein